MAAALALASERGPLAVTVGSITQRLNAPTGSFYHRFISRDMLLTELWLRINSDYQQGLTAALDAGDALGAALHALIWSRQHLNEARVLLLNRRHDFVHGEGPEALREALHLEDERNQAAVSRFAYLAFGGTTVEQLRRAQFLLVEVPVAAVLQHLERWEPPPSIVDELVITTYRAIVADDRGSTATFALGRAG
ncbi:MAG: helix-turn-helix transcriptional regulator [Alphaproteobacteria bacterium]|nr:helix-turn-helix transcriptional regulator [Alphaproteobacteria bacterium]